MTRALLALLFVFSGQTGCIYYENNGDFGGGGGTGNGWWSNGSDSPADTADTSADAPASSGLVVSPDHAAAGDTLLLNLTATVDFDLSIITDIHFEGPVTVQDVTVRDSEILIVVTIAPDATPGDVNIWVNSADGQAWNVDTALTVEPATNPSDCTCGCN